MSIFCSHQGDTGSACTVQLKIGPPDVQRLGQSSTRINEEDDQVSEVWRTNVENSSLFILGEIDAQYIREIRLHYDRLLGLLPSQKCLEPLK